MTTGDGGIKLQRQDNINFDIGTGGDILQIKVDENIKYQHMDGFGAALTDSSAWLIQDKLSTQQRNIMTKKLFSQDDGIGIGYLRLPIGASDFIKDNDVYTYDDISCGINDWGLLEFTIDHDKAYIIPVLEEAIKINPELNIMASPWTAPAWMKDNCSFYSGQLKDDSGYTEVYSDYFASYIQAYRDEGISIQAVTLQNEPRNTDNSLPSMEMDWWDHVNLLVYDLVDDFKDRNIDTEIIIYDHNWDNTSFPLNIMDDLQLNHNEVYRAVSGTTFHCYSGTPCEQTKMHNAHPEKGIYFTECTGWYEDSTGPDVNFEGDLVWEVQNLIIGAVRNWAKTVIMWNIALDQNGGPHLPTACGENEGRKCRGLVTINTENDQLYCHVDYYALGHASKFVNPGAYRIASDTYEDKKIESVAFRNTDDSKVLIVLNSSEEEQKFKVIWNDQHFDYSLNSKSVATFKWD